MRKILGTICLLFSAGLVAGAQGAKPNFSGTWHIDLAKSNFGPAPPPESMVLVVEHKEPGIKIKSTQKSTMGEMVNDRSLTTDGKPNVNTIRTYEGDQIVTSTSKWDAGKFVTSYQYEVQGMKADVVDTWELSANGAVLTIKRDITAGADTFTIQTVFNKK